MSKTLEFFFDFGSPYSYLAYTQVAALAERAAAELVYRPILLGGVFKETGNDSPAALAAKAPYMAADLERCAARYGVPFAHNPHFPVNTLQLMRGALVAQEDDYFRVYADAVYRAMWVEERNMGDRETVAEVLEAAGVAPGPLMARIADPGIKERLIAVTGEAVARGMFGAPTFFVGDEMYFGQDRMDFVEAALAA